MIIDPIDLKLIRQLELQGSITTNEIVNKFHITKEEILLRVKNFEDSGFINNYGIKLFLPRIIGGKWYWVCAAIECTPKFRPEKTVPYIEESVENLTFPRGIGPDVSLLLYTQAPKEVYKRIYKTPEVKYVEIYKVDEYNVSVPKILLKSDWQLIAKLIVMSKLNYDKINALVYEPHSEPEIKLSGLIWSKNNPKGIISILPNFNWSIIKNYSHLHLAIATKIRSKDVRKVINELGFSANIISRFKKRYLQIEFDSWGFSDLQNIITSFRAIDKMTIEGCSFAHRNIIYTDWIKNFINEKI